MNERIDGVAIPSGEVKILRQWTDKDGTVRADLEVDPEALQRAMQQLERDPDAAEQEASEGVVDEEPPPPPHYSDDWGLVLWPNKVLTQPCEPVTEFDEDLERCAARMLAIMYQHKGIGLAAPQVGWNKQVIVFDLAPGYGAPAVLCNPKIVEQIGEQQVGVEGCLSFPTVQVKLKRPETIRFTAHTMNGEVADMEVSGLIARVIQHETDHLNGVLFTNHASSVERSRIEGKLKKLRSWKKQVKALERSGITAQTSGPKFKVLEGRKRKRR